MVLISNPVSSTALALDFDPVWFGVTYLLNMEMAATSPPYGLALFIMKSVASPDTKQRRTALPRVRFDSYDNNVCLSGGRAVAARTDELARLV